LASAGTSRYFRLRVVARLALIYVGATALAYGSAQVVALSALQDSTARSLLLPITIFVTTTATLFLPVSIVVGGGYQGLHDRITHLAIVPGHEAPAAAMPIRTLMARTFIVTTALSVVLTGLETALMLRSGFSPASPTDRLLQDEKLQRLDRILGDRSNGCFGSTQTSEESRTFWVNLRCGTIDGESTTKYGAPVALHEGKVLGYGFDIERTVLPTFLVSLARKHESILPAGSKLLNAYLFLDSTAYHSHEIRGHLATYLTDRLLAGGLGKEYNAARVKFIRFTSVAMVSVGVEDVFYLTDGVVWRNALMLDIPAILRYSNFYPPPQTYVTDFELR